MLLSTQQIYASARGAVRYEDTDTIINGKKSEYPPVSSAIRKTPVSGAWNTPDIRAAIPKSAKFLSETGTPQSLILQSVANR